jgi:COMPASS component SWD3
MTQKSPPLTHITFSPNGSYLLASALDDSLRLWNWRTEQGRVVRTLSGHANANFCLPAYFVHGSCVAAASEDGAVALWNIATGKVSVSI